MASRRTVTLGQLGLLTFLDILAGLGLAFWARPRADARSAAVTEWLIVAAFAATLIAILNAALSAAALRFVLKPAAAIPVILSATIAYFTRKYATAIGANMTRNILARDAHETEELLRAHLFGIIFRAGIMSRM